MPLSDGGRWVVYAPAVDTLRVIDEQTGTAWNERIPCVTAPLYGTGIVTAVGAGAALVACTDPQRPLLLELETRTWREVPGGAALVAGFIQDSGRDRVVFDAIGTRWVHATGTYYHGGNDFWLDRETGARGPQPTADTFSDLDAPQLNVPLCAPLRRGESSSDALLYAWRRYDEVAVDGTLAVTTGYDMPPTLLRCGSGARLRLDAGDAWPNDLQLRDGVVNWRSDKDRVFLNACGVRLTWQSSDRWVRSQRSLYRATVAGTGTVSISRAPLPTCATTRSAAAVRASSGGRTATAARISGRWPAADGAVAEQLEPTGSLPLLRLAADRTVTLRTPLRATSVRWRAGASSGTAGRTRGGWRLRLPARLRGTRQLTLTLRGGNGATDVTQQLRVRATSAR